MLIVSQTFGLLYEIYEEGLVKFNFFVSEDNFRFRILNFVDSLKENIEREREERRVIISE